MPGPRSIRRYWGALPLLAIALLLGLRALLHVPAERALAAAPGEPGDPPHTTAYAGSIYVARGGPVIFGVHSPHAPARLQVAGRDLQGTGVVKERVIVPRGATAIRAALPAGARLVWNPVGRRGDPQYVGASDLSPEPPERATFDAPGTARTDGVIALAIVLVLVGAALYAARRRLARVPRETWLAMAAVFVAALAIRLFDLGGAGQTWDEDVNWASGRNYVQNVLALDVAPSSWIWNYEHPPVMKYLAGIGALLADGFGPARAISAILVALGCALLVPIGARLYALRVGILAAAIATLLPPLIAHAKVVGHEAPTVLWWSLGVLLALGVHDDLPEDKPTRALALRLACVGGVVGIAIASRFVNGLLGPLCALIVVANAPPRWRKQTLIWGAALMPLAAVAVFYLVWPRLWGQPLDALAASFAKMNVLHSPEPFLGEVTQRPGPHYFAVYLYATLPLGVLACLLAFAVRAIRQRDRAALLVVAWLAIPLAAAFSPVRQDGVRYIMPCFAAASMAAAAGVDHLLRARRVFLAGAAAIVIYLGIVVARTHPYYLDYFGEHTGGAGRVARDRWLETAWWGEGLGAALDHVNRHAAPNAAVARDCVEPSHLAWLREDLWSNVPRTGPGATWIIVYAPHRWPCPIPADARRVFAVEHDGVILAAVYKRD